MDLRGLCKTLASTVPELYLLMKSPEPHPTTGYHTLQTTFHKGRRIAPLFTSEAAARRYPKGKYAVKDFTAHVLRQVIRQEIEGIVLNPGTDNIYLNEEELHVLYRECTLQVMASAGGSFVLAKDGRPLILTEENGDRTLPLYHLVEDAREQAELHGMEHKFLSWAEIDQIGMDANVKYAAIQMDCPEEEMISFYTVRHIASLRNPAVVEGLAALERELKAASNQHGRSDGIIRALLGTVCAWGLAPRDCLDTVATRGKMLYLFTSMDEAEVFLIRESMVDPTVLELVPALFGTEDILKAVQAHHLTVVINSGSPRAWYGLGLGLDVPKLMRQMAGEEEKVVQ